MSDKSPNAPVSAPQTSREGEEYRDIEVRATDKPQLEAKLIVTATDTREQHAAIALIDSGCSRSSIDREYVRLKGLTTCPMANPHPAWNADGSLNGYIKDFVELEIEMLDSAR
ncbi:hypothetical protein AURDEDRAFT_170216 [Auricularia subglabra TFB-10046 SS5]|nr:hypothetical protein AURDEDRAFT_170216 [Auricularia subglabra TFB-10046 SS5]